MLALMSDRTRMPRSNPLTDDMVKVAVMTSVNTSQRTIPWSMPYIDSIPEPTRANPAPREEAKPRAMASTDIVSIKFVQNPRVTFSPNKGIRDAETDKDFCRLKYI